jgi:hypothetical protein
MLSGKDLQKLLKERTARAASRGFTREYQDEKEQEGNTIDTTLLFNIYKKYLPERSRLSENIFKEAALDSDIGSPEL